MFVAEVGLFAVVVAAAAAYQSYLLWMSLLCFHCCLALVSH